MLQIFKKGVDKLNALCYYNNVIKQTTFKER